MLIVPMLLLAAVAIVGCHALIQQETSSWHPLPHFARRDMLLGGAAALATATTTNLLGIEPARAMELANTGPRSIASIDSNLAIPVWPSWGGGRVVPVSLGGPLHDPFLLLAHHKHWFDPRDPLRGPFKALGKALGLPYVDVEGFKLHPHRGFDILTYVLDGSDGFRHRDSLGGSRVYRGGCAQWMRTGSGVLHEEFWETRNDRRTNIELFQLWINLPAKQKFDPPYIHYVGATTVHPWVEHHSIATGVKVRDIGATLDASLPIQKEEEKEPVVNSRPPVSVLHVTMQAGSQWETPTPRGYSALLYVREGTATLPSLDKSKPEQTANALQTATFGADGDSIVVHNTQRRPLDFLLLTAAPLREPVTLGGPIVMNTEEELTDAFRQLSEGTFLKRNVALRQQADNLRRTGRMV